MTTSVQVGFFCYQPGAAASTAACAAVVPRFDTVGNDVVYLACSGIDSSNKLLMQTTTARRDGLTPPIISTVAISPLFSDCMWTESIAAGETLCLCQYGQSLRLSKSLNGEGVKLYHENQEFCVSNGRSCGLFFDAISIIC